MVDKQAFAKAVTMSVADLRQRGFTMEKIAAKLKIKRDGLYCWMRGEKFPREIYHPIIKRVLKIDVSEYVR